jgi:hypothetical protein
MMSYLSVGTLKGRDAFMSVCGNAHVCISGRLSAPNLSDVDRKDVHVRLQGPVL